MKVIKNFYEIVEKVWASISNPKYFYHKSHENLTVCPFFKGLPQHATLAPATYYTSHNEDNGSQSPTKYHENGHDTFSDFVTLVCQEAQSTQASTIHSSGGPRSPKVTMAPSYFSSSPQVSTESSAGSSATGLYPPPPQAPSARPVALIRSSGID